jgi:hypothetical protein
MRVMTAEEQRADKRQRATIAAAALVAYGSWLGQSKSGVVGGATSYEDLKGWLRGHADRDPLDTAVTTALVGGVVFYLAERKDNPRVQTPLDGILYIATSLSVGYADYHPKTELGKVIASAVQTVGPAMAARALDTPKALLDAQAAMEREESLALQRQILSKLEAIHGALQARD